MTCLVTFKPTIPQKTPRRNIQKLSAMHATRRSIVATVIWRIGRSMSVIMGSRLNLRKEEDPVKRKMTGRSSRDGTRLATAVDLPLPFERPVVAATGGVEALG